MIIQKIFIGLLVILAVMFLGFQIFDLEVVASGIRAVLLVFLTLLYWHNAREMRYLFLAFLISFTIADIAAYLNWVMPRVSENGINFAYYIGNLLYIIAYSFLIIEILISMNLVEVVKKYAFHILILILLDVFSVVVVTDTAMSKLTNHEYYLEFVYNSVIMILMTMAVINYIHKDDKKALNLLLGSIFIFFSEVIQLAYFYISDNKILNVLCSLFLLLAFLFFYLQSKLTYPTTSSINTDLMV